MPSEKPSLQAAGTLETRTGNVYNHIEKYLACQGHLREQMQKEEMLKVCFHVIGEGRVL